jgi:hypothetical protein
MKNHSEDNYQKTGIKSRKDFISKTSKLDQEPECLNICEERADVKKLFQGSASISKGNHQPAPGRRPQNSELNSFFPVTRAWPPTHTAIVNRALLLNDGFPAEVKIMNLFPGAGSAVLRLLLKISLNGKPVNDLPSESLFFMAIFK